MKPEINYSSALFGLPENLHEIFLKDGLFVSKFISTRKFSEGFRFHRGLMQYIESRMQI